MLMVSFMPMDAGMTCTGKDSLRTKDSPIGACVTTVRHSGPQAFETDQSNRKLMT